MKKTLLVAALAAILVFAVVGSAFATFNRSGTAPPYGRLGAKASAPANVTVVDTETVQNGGGTTITVTPGIHSIVGAGTNTYYDWKPSLFGNAQTDPLLPDFAGNSPHGNYTTTTVKCVVCHSVHYAAPGGSPVSGGTQTADTLLRNRADSACVFCHAAADEAVNGTPVYDGLGSAIMAPGQTGGNTNTGHRIGNDCDECHSSVHGWNADTTVASLDGFLLKLIPTTMGVANGPNGSGGVQHGVPSNSMMDAIVNIELGGIAQGFTGSNTALPGSISDYSGSNTPQLREEAVGVFCAECHDGAYATGAPGASTNVSSSDSAAYTGHRIRAGITSWNALGDKSSSAISGQQIAWAPADNCKSCHDSLDIYGNGAFPHAWGRDSAGNYTKMWLLSAPDAGTTKTTIGDAASHDYRTSPVQLTDGVCLKCHVAPGGNDGVGKTF